jgi:HSP20 family protein
MADIVRSNPDFMTPLRARDPFQLMRDMLSWDPFQQLERGFALDRGESFLPAFDLKETKDSFILRADLPGVKEDDIDLSLTGNRLTVSGKREAETEDESDQHYIYERSYGSFTRTFTLPEDCDVDHVSAELKDGVLSVQIPKKPEAQPRKISLKGLKDKVVSKLKA